MKKILYLDMDGVVADFNHSIKQIFPEIENYTDVEERNSKIDAIVLQHENFFPDMKPVHGSVDYVRNLFDIYDVYFLSTPMFNVPHSYMGKRIWLERVYGELAQKRLILTHRKDLAIGDYLVDDRLKNGAADFSGRLLLFGSSEFPDWEETYNYLVKNA